MVMKRQYRIGIHILFINGRFCLFSKAQKTKFIAQKNIVRRRITMSRKERYPMKPEKAVIFLQNGAETSEKHL